MFDARKSKIGHVRRWKIENKPCSTPENRKQAMFDFPKSKIGHVRLMMQELFPVRELHDLAPLELISES